MEPAGYEVMADPTNVKITSWPPEPALGDLRASAAQGQGIPLAVAAQAARALISSRIDRPTEVALALRAAIVSSIPVCIGICEDLCTWSDYTVEVMLFDNPIISITVQGTTKLTRCDQER
jgi:hypothetical protein